MATTLLTTTRATHSLIPTSAVQSIEGIDSRIVAVWNDDRIAAKKSTDRTTTLYTVPKD